MDRNLEDQYELEIAAGYSTLERVGDYEFRTDPNQAFDEDPYADLYENAIYGGEAHPEQDQHFFIYQVDWPDGVDQPSGAAKDELGEELNSVFDGWIINKEGDQVFALNPEEH